MVRKDIQQLLQECLEGYDAGLTPEECLSAYPRVRAELEPLFRQAISLRVAYAASPSREFRYRAREKLMFAAGRDVTKALSAEPDPEFVRSTRQRLLNRAGAAAQEALRDVPPPRLPFWMNARRRLLETAASAPPRRAQHAAMTVRYALSAAVIVLAMAIAGAGFFLEGSPVNHRSENASAELNYISNKLADYEQLKASGQIVSSSMLDDLATRTKELVEKTTAANPDQEVLAKLPELIDRQRHLAEDDDESNDQALASVQQRLNEADQQVAAAVVSPSPQPTTTEETSALAPTPAETVQPTPAPTETATATPEATETVTVPAFNPADPSTLGHGQIVTQLDPSLELLGLHWVLVTTDALRFPMPESWVVTNMITDENGFAMLTQPEYLLIKTDVDGITLVVANSTGKVDTVIDGTQHTLREPGVGVSPIAPDDLYQLAGADTDAFALFNMLNSIDVFGEQPTSTPEATSTPESTATSTATPTETTTPEATPEVTSTPTGTADASNP